LYRKCRGCRIFLFGPMPRFSEEANMATLASKLALRRAWLTGIVLALCISAFGQSVGVPPPPDSRASQPVQPPPGMQWLEVGSRVVQTQPHLPGSNFPPSIRQITGKPYSLVLESEQKQTLADGTNISRKTMVRREYRDSMGRTRTEHEGVPFPGQPMNSFPMIRLADPVARYQYTLDTRAKTAKRMVAKVCTRVPRCPCP
jgi:hypothetical protein